MSTQNFISGCSVVARCKNSCASWIVYGCGKRSRTPSQILRLFACVAMDSASSSRHGRMVHCLSVSCMCLPYIRSAFALWESMEGGAMRRHALALQSAARRGLAELASPFSGSQPVLLKTTTLNLYPFSWLCPKAKTKTVVHRADQRLECDFPMDRESRSETAAPV